MIVLAGRGPLGAGMEEVYQLTSALKYLDVGPTVALITDARFSGVSTGPCIGHVGPEALAGGPIGRLRDGDLVRVVIDTKRLAGTIDLVRTDAVTGEDHPARRGAGAAADARGFAGRRGAAGRDAPVGGAPGRERRHLGRLRLRCRQHRPTVERGEAGAQPCAS